MKQTRKRILLADCHEDVLISLEKLLEDAGFDTAAVWTVNEALKLIEACTFDLVLISENQLNAECEEMLHALQRKREQTPCIVMSPSTLETADLARFAGLNVKAIVCKRPYKQIVEIVKEYLFRDQEQSKIA